MDFDLQFKDLFFVLPKLVRSRAGPDTKHYKVGASTSEVAPLGTNSLCNIKVQQCNIPPGV